MMPPGMLKLSRSVDPRIPLTLLPTDVATAGPSHEDERVTMMLAGVIVPAGNPDPNTLTFVTPATPLLGEVSVASVIWPQAD